LRFVLWRGICSSDTRVCCFRYLTILNPMGSLIVRLYNLRWNYNLLLNNKEAGVVLVCSTVVCAGSDCDALATRKTIDSIWTNLVCSDHDRQLIHFQEFFNNICSVKSYVILFYRISDYVWSEANNFIV